MRISLLGRECVTGALVFGNQVLLGAILDGGHGLGRASSATDGDGQSAQSEYSAAAGEAGGLKIQRFARGEYGENRWWEPLSGRFTPASVSLIREPIEFDRFKASVTGRCAYF